MKSSNKDYQYKPLMSRPLAVAIMILVFGFYGFLCYRAGGLLLSGDAMIAGLIGLAIGLNEIRKHRRMTRLNSKAEADIEAQSKGQK